MTNSVAIYVAAYWHPLNAECVFVHGPLPHIKFDFYTPSLSHSGSTASIYVCAELM